MDRLLILYQQTLEQVKSAIHSYEPDDKGYMDPLFFDENLERGIQKFEHITQILIGETNAELRKIQDMVQLLLLDDKALLFLAQKTRQRKNIVMDHCTS